MIKNYKKQPFDQNDKKRAKTTENNRLTKKKLLIYNKLFLTCLKLSVLLNFCEKNMLDCLFRPEKFKYIWLRRGGSTVKKT